MLGATLVAVLTIFTCAMLFGKRPVSHTDINVPAESTDAGSGELSPAENQTPETSDFTVSVTDADGNWNRTQVKQSDKAALTVSEQDKKGFKFSFNASGGEKSSKLSGQAFFTSENTADYTYGAAGIKFAFQEDMITVSHSGELSGLGCPEGVTFDGSYTKKDPVYTDNLVDESYSADIRKSTMIISALKGCMTGADYEKMNYIFENGQEFVYQNDEYAYDKDGVEINVDAEMKAVKYYADIAGSGEHVILICTNGGKVYVAIISDGELRYYSNDASRYDTPPKSFVAAAENYEVKIKKMSK